MNKTTQENTKWGKIWGLLMYDDEGARILVMKDEREDNTLIVLDENYPAPYLNPYDESMTIAEFGKQFQAFPERAVYDKKELKDLMRLVLEKDGDYEPEPVTIKGLFAVYVTKERSKYPVSVFIHKVLKEHGYEFSFTRGYERFDDITYEVTAASTFEAKNATIEALRFRLQRDLEDNGIDLWEDVEILEEIKGV